MEAPRTVASWLTGRSASAVFGVPSSGTSRRRMGRASAASRASGFTMSTRRVGGRGPPTRGGPPRPRGGGGGAVPGDEALPRRTDLAHAIVLSASARETRSGPPRWGGGGPAGGETPHGRPPPPPTAPRPPGRVRREGKAVLAQRHAAEAEHGRLPEPTQRPHVQAGGAVAHAVVQVDGGGLAKVALGQGDHAEPRGHPGMDRRAQGAAVAAARPVVGEAVAPRPRREGPREH